MPADIWHGGGGGGGGKKSVLAAMLAAQESAAPSSAAEWSSQGTVWHPDNPSVGLYSTAAPTQQVSVVENAVAQMVAARAAAEAVRAPQRGGGGGAATAGDPLAALLGGYGEVAFLDGGVFLAGEEEEGATAEDGESFDDFITRRVFKSTTNQVNLGRTSLPRAPTGSCHGGGARHGSRSARHSYEREREMRSEQAQEAVEGLRCAYLLCSGLTVQPFGLLNGRTWRGSSAERAVVVRGVGHPALAVAAFADEAFRRMLLKREQVLVKFA